MQDEKQAVILADAELDRARSVANLEEDVMLLLSFKAGLRAGEIASADWRWVRTASGELADFVDVPPSATKRHLGAGRITMHAELRAALLKLSASRRHPMQGPIICQHAGAAVQSLEANSVAKRFKRLFARAGMARPSSHSGRRTYGTKLAGKINLPSLQLAMRHQDRASTLRYVDPASDAAISAAIKSL